MIDDPFWWFVVVLVAVLFGFISRGIIGAGRESAGFWMGFLLGPFGVIIALIIRAASPARAETVPARPTRKCSECAEIILAEARKCRYCGADQQTAVATPRKFR